MIFARDSSVDCCDAPEIGPAAGYTSRMNAKPWTTPGGPHSNTTGPAPGVRGPDGWLLRVVRDRRVAFLMVGAINTVVGGLWFVVFDALIGTLWGGAGHYVALVLTYAAAILSAFVLYRKIVFRVRGHVFRDLARFSSVYLWSFVINVALFAALHNGFGVHPLAAQLVNIVAISVMSYFLHRDFSFARPTHQQGKYTR